MSSNNPFAAALNEPDSYVHHRDPPPPPRTTSHSITPPARPPKPEVLAPPSYEEVADRKSREYPKEKESSGSSSSSGRHHTSLRQHRSHSDSRPHRSSREKTSTSSSSKPHRRHKSPTKKKSEPVKAKNLDTIDKLDVTGFFGGGFHHDGPFDACRPHRNKNVKAAPVMAFPIDGPNNSIKGLSGNVDKNEQMNLAFGNYSGEQNEVLGRAGSVKRANGASPLKSGDEGGLIKTNRIGADPAASYTPSHNPGVVNFDSNVKAEPVHGVVTAGLGSSTFIDGAPAPKAALNDEFLNVNNGGLGRKKSLVSRLRRNSNSENNSRRNSNDSGPAPESGRRGSLNNVQFDEEPVHESGGASSLLRRVKSLKVRK
jgi:hypothetical protein